MNTGIMAYDRLDKVGKEDYILNLTERLILTITRGDYQGYTELTDPNLTCFEPEAFSNLVAGMDFHKFYFDNHVISKPHPGYAIKTHLLNPKVHMLGENAACIAYVRVTQYVDKDRKTKSMQSEETRVWHRINNRWMSVHFHRSGATSAPQW
ncbi:calcium/calmodulin-dependent protein kinase type II delta chain-like [Lineus longissimus]|uniref:calcium/calmodulin-dependent protein kinase type II delta chain-like n=1 Tax=Lineus longissimus TaxID=88925 RepID=UPI002B4DDCB5